MPGYVAVLNSELSALATINHGNLDEFKGVRGHTVTIRVPGKLPARSYQFPSGSADPTVYNDRTEEITFDEYSETSVDLKIAGHAYSAVKIIDEQAAFDLKDANSLVPAQGRAVAASLNTAAVNLIQGAPYLGTIGVVDSSTVADPTTINGSIRRSLIEARRVLNSFLVPPEGRVLLVGSDFEANLLSDDRIVLASNVGFDQAANALHSATLGTLLGFKVVVDQRVPAGEAYAYVPSAFALRMAVPPAAPSAPFSAHYASNGVSLRWVRDYDIKRQQDLSVLDTYYGTQAILDNYNYWDDTAFGGLGGEVVGDRLFMRGIKLEVGAVSAWTTDGQTVSDNLNIGSLWTPKVS